MEFRSRNSQIAFLVESCERFQDDLPVHLHVPDVMLYVAALRAGVSHEGHSLTDHLLFLWGPVHAFSERPRRNGELLSTINPRLMVPVDFGHTCISTFFSDPNS